jgi:CheY-like chemotaxis protein
MPDGAPRAETPQLRVLVVDDYQDGADSMRLMLRALGTDARAVYDGPAAVDIMDEFRPHLVLLDLGLPGGLTGVDVGRTILGQARWPPRIVAVSGWSHDEAMQACRDAGFTGFLVKPVVLDAITALLDELRRHLPPEPATPDARP